MLQKFAAFIGAAALTVACAQTDAGITTNVKSKMAADDTVKAYQIDVDTSNGVVTLTGSVDSPVAKEKAVMLARQTEGVNDVVDRIAIGTGPTSTTGEIREDNRDLGRDTADDARDTAREAGDLLRHGAGHAGQRRLARRVVDRRLQRSLPGEGPDVEHHAALGADHRAEDGAGGLGLVTIPLFERGLKGLELVGGHVWVLSRGRLVTARREPARAEDGLETNPDESPLPAKAA